MISLRDARETDAPSLSRIYNAEVASGVSNYETEAPSEEARREWIRDLSARHYPVLVAEREGEIVGFAALTPFHRLGGYRFTVSGSIYVADGHRRSGVGVALGHAILRGARAREYHSILAGVNSENAGSIGLLESLGFQRVGYFKQIGFKNGRWHDDVCLQLILSDSKPEEKKP